MKKMFLAIAMVMGLGTSVAFAQNVMLNDTVVVDSTKQKEPAVPVEKKSFALNDTVVVDSTKQKDPAVPVEKKSFALNDTVVVDSTKQKEPAAPVEKKEPEPVKTSFSQTPKDDFTAIDPSELPEPVMVALAKNHEGDTIKEAYVAVRESGKVYKIVISQVSGSEVTVFYNGKGEQVEG